MINSRLIDAFCICMVTFGVLSSVSASTIFVSGDTNISNALDGSDGFTINEGNQQFFTNILQGGSNVAVLATNNGLSSLDNADGIINTFYNSLSGVSSTILTSTVTSSGLAGIDLFVSAMPDDPFSAGEIGILSNFLNSGGNIFFLGDNSSVAVPYNNSINDVLTNLGSSISILNTVFDSGIQTATGSQITVDPITTGITSFSYAAPSQISSGADGIVLFTGSSNRAFLAYQVTVVPIPPALFLFGSGLLGLIGIARRKKA